MLKPFICLSPQIFCFTPKKNPVDLKTPGATYINAVYM